MVADPETLRRTWRRQWIHCLYEFASPRLQRMSWLEGSAKWPNGQEWSSSPVECICRYFDDLNLSAGLDWTMKDELLTAAEVAIARRFHDIASGYRIPAGPYQEMIADPHWAAVVMEASAFWQELKKCVAVDELSEMAALESSFGQIDG